MLNILCCFALVCVVETAHTQRTSYKSRTACVPQHGCKVCDIPFTCSADPCQDWRQHCPEAHYCVANYCFGCNPFYYDKMMNTVKPQECYSASVIGAADANTLRTNWLFVVLACATLLLLIPCCCACFFLLCYSISNSFGARHSHKEKGCSSIEMGHTASAHVSTAGGSYFGTSHEISPENIKGVEIAIKELPHIPRSCISIAHMLGRGAFGEVYEGQARKLSTGASKTQRVAIKTLQPGSRDDERVRFLKEALVMSHFAHENIVRLLGVCRESEPHWIILELMEGGDLLTYLRDVRPTATTPSQVCLSDLLYILMDVCSGCTYLQSLHHVHRDLAARNCLISTRQSLHRCVKIADFGMTRDVYEDDYYRVDGKGMLPVRWMAPESMIEYVFTPKTDVWSFGVVMWEVLTLGQQPYSGRHNWDVLNFVCHGGLLQCPPSCAAVIYDLMLECWKFNADDRPMFVDIQPKVESLACDKTVFEARNDPFPLLAESASPNHSISTAGSTRNLFDGRVERQKSISSDALNVQPYKNKGLNAALQFASDRSVNSFSAKGTVEHILRSFRKQKPKQKPLPPPSKATLDSRSLSQATSCSTVCTVAQQLNSISNEEGGMSRPDSALDNHSAARGYEVPLLKAS